jgi:hypothetical protein
VLFHIFGAVVLSILLTLAFLAPLGAQSPHRQCNTADPALARGETGVIADDQAFLRRSRSVDFAIFGLGAANPEVTQDPYEICLRYEFENRSKEEIQELRWKDAGLANLSSLPPGQRHRMPRRKSSNTRQVTTSNTDIYAFENAKATGRTVFAVQQSVARSAAAQPSGGGSSRYSLVEAYPALKQQLASAGATADAVTAFYLPERTSDYRTLSIGLELPDVVVAVESSATISPSDRFATVKGEIRISNNKLSGPVAVYAPGLNALQRARFANDGTVPGRSADFLKLLGDSAGPLSGSGTTYATSIGFRTASTTTTPSLFIVEHPVTITIGAWSACLIAETYSPVPVTLSDTHCRKR